MSDATSVASVRLRSDAIPQRAPHPAAQWIWLPAPRWPDRQCARASVFAPDLPGQPVSVSRFVTAFDVPDELRSADLVISADTRYRAYVNGLFIGDGPTRAGGDYDNAQSPDWWFSDQVDLFPHLRAGRNVLGVEVVLGPTRQQDYSMGRGGLLADLEMTTDSGSISVVTGSDWRCAPSAAHVTGTQTYDARLESDPAWAVDPDVSRAWEPAMVVGDSRVLTPSGLLPLTRTEVRPLQLIAPFPDQASLLQQETDGRVVVTAPGPCTFWLDFGRIHAAHMLLALEGEPGAVVTCEPQEIIGRTDKNGTPESITARGERIEYRGIELRSCRYLKVTVSNLGDDPVVLVDPRIEAVSYHPAPVGSFACGDAEIERIYAASVWTEQICSQTIHLDSPVHQEGLGCTGDYLIQSLIDYRVFGDATLARADVLRTARLLRQKDAVMFHPSYSLLWIEMLRDFWRNTGDAEIVAEVLDCVEALLRRFEGYLGSEGLISSAPSYMFIDWVRAHGHTYHHPPRFMGQGPLTMFLVGAYRNAGELYEACGQAEHAAQARARAETTAADVHAALWRPEIGMYADGLLGVDENVIPSRWLPDDPGQRESFSPHTNVLAVRYGICPGTEAQLLLRRVLEDSTIPQMQPYFLHFAFDALDRVGLYDELAVGLIRRWSALLREEPGSLKEVWNGFDCDYSHSWSATPAYQIAARVLGIEPGRPGFEVLSVSPSLGDLAWASGLVPVPQGPVQVSLKRSSQSIDGDIVVPPGLPVLITFERMAACVAGLEIETPEGERILGAGYTLSRELPARDESSRYRVMARLR